MLMILCIFIYMPYSYPPATAKLFVDNSYINIFCRLAYMFADAGRVHCYYKQCNHAVKIAEKYNSQKYRNI